MMKKYLFFVVFLMPTIQAFLPMDTLNFRGRYYCETARVIIRTLSLDDVQDLFEWCSDERVTTWLTWYPHKNISQTIKYVNIILERQKNGRPEWWALVDKKTKKVFGLGGFHEWDLRHKKAEIGIILAPSYWNKGYATEIIQSLLSFAFTETDVNRIEALVACKNIASCKLFKKIGFTNEGRLRDYKLLKGRFVDHYMFSLTRSEMRSYYFSQVT